MARRRVRGEAQWHQLVLPGFETWVTADPVRAEALGGKEGASTERGWEVASFAEGCWYGRQVAGARLAGLEARLHAQRPAGWQVEGWRERTLVTRMGDLRVRRRRYRDPAGQGHFLLDEHLGWTPGQVATPDFTALLVDWAADVPFRVAARHLAGATAGVLSGPTVWRYLAKVAGRVTASEQAAHQAWAREGTLPAPVGERVVPVLYVEADGVFVKTQREPTHRRGYELKCASAYEGWARVGEPTPGHPRAHYRLVAKQVYCHAFAQDLVPFWEGVSLHLSRTYDLSQVRLIPVGGDGAAWIDGAREVFPQWVRTRDGFHLGRDAARGWGAEVGATLYQTLRAGDPATARALLALPPPARHRERPALPAPATPLALPAPLPARTTLTSATPGAPPAPGAPAAPASAPRRLPRWSHPQVAKARASLQAQVATPDGGADWRTQVPPEAVPPGARAMGTQEGTNAHLLARRMKKKGMAWTIPGGRAMAKLRELVTTRTLAPWCVPRPPPPRPGGPWPTGRAAAGPLPWPQVSCPAAHGPARDPLVRALQQTLAGGFHRRT